MRSTIGRVALYAVSVAAFVATGVLGTLASQASVTTVHVGTFQQTSGAPSDPPVGVRLQRAAGDGFEVVYDPGTGVYTVEPR